MDEQLQYEFILIELKGSRSNAEGRAHAVCPWCDKLFHVLVPNDIPTCSLPHCWEIHKGECADYKKARRRHGPSGASE